MALKRINIQDLKLGMFVSELDISWVKSPFFRHKRLIVKQEDIELLKKAGVESLVIDVDKSKVAVPDPKSVPKPASLNEAVTNADSVDAEGAAETNEDKTVIQKPAPEKKGSPFMKAPKVPLKEEFKVAKRIQSEVLNAVDQIQSAFETGRSVSQEQVNPVVEKTLESIDNNSQAIMALLHEGRDGGKIATHSFGVFALVLLLSSHLEYSVEDQQALGLAALTHDAGWTKLPTHLMGKGKPYTASEKKLVAQHIPIVKGMVKQQAELSEGVISAIEQHHEYLDGSGYPMQLKEESIHPWARLLATCNEYDELVHGLGESPGMTPQNALSALFQLSKKGKLDRYFTTNLISLLGVYPLGSAVELDNGQIGVVIEISHQSPLKPIVKVFYDKAKTKAANPSKVSLLDKDIKIKRVLDLYGKDSHLDPEKLLVFSGDMLQ
ncbi:MAG TPA: hypothetical protein DHW71_13025 [Gammaproteobacteria bacterium]|nr:hypothetical protein [Gammaproteobacteria bacterium]HBF08874.1 hypothetical protein [Gammaproteobacteria bacterium]HCK93914.1 hypothetical protein [Gammaproteobacteria bacterium]|tara:strand:- start:79154 stop:80464 length:1311 start_codon:yes stop_codon:yes gene_type:complete